MLRFGCVIATLTVIGFLRVQGANLIKRQSSGGDFGCFALQLSQASPSERACFPQSLADGLTATAFVTMCSSRQCIDFVKQITLACRLLTAQQAQAVDALCSRDVQGIPCYSVLPLDLDNPEAFLSPCSSILDSDGSICSEQCNHMIQNYTSNCCLATLLPVAYNSDEINELWSACGVTPPHQCASIGGTDSTLADSKGGSSHSSVSVGIVMAAVIGGLVVFGSAIALVVVLFIFLRKRRRTLSVSSGDVMAHSLLNEDENNDV